MEKIDPQEIQRLVNLALMLEPLAEKEGCTTRLKDLSPELKLVDFQVAAINSGKYFNELAIRIKKNGKQPKVIYDLCYEALKNSTKNLHNKKYVNYGLVDIMLFIVVSHLVYGGSASKICNNVVKVLKNSSKKDVFYKNKIRKEAWKTSRDKRKQTYIIDDSSKNLFEDFKLHLKKQGGLGLGTFWLEQICAGLPLLQKMYAVARKTVEKKGLIAALEKAFAFGRIKTHKIGALADYTAAIAYLLLIQPKSQHWIR